MYGSVRPSPRRTVRVSPPRVSRTSDREGIAVEADLGEEGEHRRAVVDEHRSQRPGGGGVAEGPEDLRTAGAPGFEQGSAALGLVAEDPEVPAIVEDVGAFVFDVDLATPQALALEAEVVGDDVLEEPLAAGRLRRGGQVAVRHAAQHQGAGRVDFEAAVDVGEVLEHDHRRVAVGQSEVRLQAVSVVDHAAESGDAADPAADDDGGEQAVAAGEEDGGGPGVEGLLDGGGGVRLAGGIGAEPVDVGPRRGIVPGDLGGLADGQSQGTGRAREGRGGGMGEVLGDVGSLAARFVGALEAGGGGGIGGGDVPEGAGVAGGGDIAEVDSAAVVIDEGGEVGGGVAAAESGFDQGKRAIGSEGGDGVVAEESADGDGLALVFEADLGLAAQGDVFEGLAVDRVAGDDAASEADDFAVSDEERSVHVAVGEVEAVGAASRAGDEAAVADGARIVRVELEGGGAGVVGADVEGEGFDVVVEPVGRAEAAAPHHGPGFGGVGEGVVAE
jgi:hypothetical protein